MSFFILRRNYRCLHCKQTFLNATRKGMFDHSQTLDIDTLRNVIEAQKIFVDQTIVNRLSDYSLRNILTDLSGIVYQ